MNPVDFLLSCCPQKTVWFIFVDSRIQRKKPIGMRSETPGVTQDAISTLVTTQDDCIYIYTYIDTFYVYFGDPNHFFGIPLFTGSFCLSSQDITMLMQRLFVSNLCFVQAALAEPLLFKKKRQIYSACLQADVDNILRSESKKGYSADRVREFHPIIGLCWSWWANEQSVTIFSFIWWGNEQQAGGCEH